MSTELMLVTDAVNSEYEVSHLVISEIQKLREVKRSNKLVITLI